MAYIIIWDFGYCDAWIHLDRHGFPMTFNSTEEAHEEARAYLDGDTYSCYDIFEQVTPQKK